MIVVVRESEGRILVAEYQGHILKFEHPGFGGIGPGSRVEIEILSSQQGFWRAKFKKDKS